ncbi:MAG: HmuY family protein [Crocinitomicaceae bacterium]
MKKIVIASLAILSLGLSFTSCKKEEEKQYENEVNIYSNKYEFLDARSYTDWVYFSLTSNSIVQVTDYQNDLSWDIAFHRGDVRLNGGASGKGQGAALDSQSKDFNAVLEAPKTGYVKDSVGTVVTAFTGNGVEQEQQPFSQTLSTWLTTDISTPPPVYTVNNNVYIIKTANGSIAKIQMYDNKNATGSAGYISFKYQVNNSAGYTFK